MNELLQSIDPEILKDFLTESEDLLVSLEKDLLSLSDIDVSDPNLGLIVNNIFRYVHTFKGTAGFIGLDTLSKLAHSMENLFDKIRNKEMPLTEEMADTFFDVLDIFKIMIGDIYHCNDVEIASTVEKLDAFLEPVTAAVDNKKIKAEKSKSENSKIQVKKSIKVETEMQKIENYVQEIVSEKKLDIASAPAQPLKFEHPEDSDNANELLFDLRTLDSSQYPSVSDFIDMLLQKAIIKNVVIFFIFPNVF